MIYAEDDMSELGYVQRWEVEPPAEGVAFRVLDDEWSKDGTVRTIREFEIA